MTFRLTKKTLPYALLFPLLLSIAALFLYPLIQVIGFSLFKFSLFQFHDRVFQGLKNFSYLFTSHDFWNSVWITLIYAFGIAAGSYLVALGISLLLNNPFKGRTVARMIVFIPYAVPSVVTSLIWIWLYTPGTGVFNFVLTKLGLVSAAGVSWLSNPATALLALLVIEVWRRFPFGVIMLLAGLQSIPKSLYEIARIDGANAWQLFWNITLPSLRNISSLLFIMLTFWGFSAFDIVFLVTGGGPANATETLSIQAYQQTFLYNRVGYGSSVGVAILIVATAVVLIRFYLGKTENVA